MPRPVKSRGFTLIEILVAMVLVSFVGAALYATFSQSLRLWSRARESRPDLELELFFEEMEQDMRNALAYGGRPVRGSKQSFSFYTLARAGPARPAGPASPSRHPPGQPPGAGSLSGHPPLDHPARLEQAGLGPCRVEYFFDEKRKLLGRRLESYREILGGETGKMQRDERMTQVLARGVTRVAMEYYDWVPGTRAGSWKGNWQEACLPRAVKVNVDYGDTVKTGNLSRILALPGGGCHS